jgi:hypothetical protein
MKRNDTDNFCILYLEPGDEREALLRAIIGQQKHVVLMLAEKTRLFHRPEEYVALKHLKRELGMTISFVVASDEHVTSLARRNGFPVYSSMEALSKAFHAVETRVLAQRATIADVPTRPAAGITPPPATPMPPSSLVRKKKRTHRLPRVLIALMILTLSAAGLGWLLVYFHAPTGSGEVAPPIAGHVSFLSSGQTSSQTDQGIDDEIEVDLHNVSNPAPGQSYYAWLLGDQSQGDAIIFPLGVLRVNKGDAHLFYRDSFHTNLLAITSRFLVTEEADSPTPVAPTPDTGKWCYYGEFLQTATGSAYSSNNVKTATSASQYTFLDHLRYLLASDPVLEQNDLPGGLNNWFSQNVERVLEQTESMRGAWEGQNVTLIQQQTAQILAYIDGLSYVSQDIPAGTQFDLNDRQARIGLLTVDGPNQDPPSYLDSIVFHLNGLLQAGSSTATMRTHIAAIFVALNNVRSWLLHVRQDGRQLLQMNDAQLLQPAAFSLINDMIASASNAYAGQVDVATGRMQQGAVWIRNQLQALATLDITPYRASSSPEQIIPQSSLEAWYVRGGKW